MTYQTEFPDFAPESMPAIPAAWQDVSWHNDACPAFTFAGLRIWVDYADPAEREFQYGRRYGVMLADDAAPVHGWPVGEEVESDDWRQVLALVEAMSGTVFDLHNGVRTMADLITAAEMRAARPCPDMLDMADRARKACLDAMTAETLDPAPMCEAAREMAPLIYWPTAQEGA